MDELTLNAFGGQEAGVSARLAHRRDGRAVCITT